MSIEIIKSQLTSIQDIINTCEKIWERDDISLEDKVAFHDIVCMGKHPRPEEFRK